MHLPTDMVAAEFYAGTFGIVYLLMATQYAIGLRAKGIVLAPLERFRAEFSIAVLLLWSVLFAYVLAIERTLGADPRLGSLISAAFLVVTIVTTLASMGTRKKMKRLGRL